MNALVKKFLNKETITYIIFGVLTTAVDYIVASLFFYSLGFGELTSNNVAWVMSVAFAYITNKLFVFESKSLKPSVLFREIISFCGARVITLIITDIFLFFTSKAGINFLIAKLLISVLVIILNYIFSKLFIFKKSDNGGNNVKQDKQMVK